MKLHKDMLLVYLDDGYMYYAIHDDEEIPVGYEVLDYKPSFAPVRYIRCKRNTHLTH